MIFMCPFMYPQVFSLRATSDRAYRGHIGHILLIKK